MLFQKSTFQVIIAMIVAKAAVTDAQDGHETHCVEIGSTPVLSVADFDGDGKVTQSDVDMIQDHLVPSPYVPFFDLNADGKVNQLDLKIAKEQASNGAESTTLDKQMAQAYHATKKYKDINVAIDEGYRPTTQWAEGHGIHYSKLPFSFIPTGEGSFDLDPTYENPLDTCLSVPEPEGLNYDKYGELCAVFYYHSIDLLNWGNLLLSQNHMGIAAYTAEAFALSSISAQFDTYPVLFDSTSAIWHQHWGICNFNLDYVQLFFEATNFPPTVNVVANEHYLPDECFFSGGSWIPAANMIHVWIHKLNPCGIFAGVHPDVNIPPDSPPLVDKPRTIEEWFEKMEIDNPYEGAPHQHV